MTTKELAASHAEMAERSQYLWKSAHLDVARICRTYHRGRARAMLFRLRKKYRDMAISLTYMGAAECLSVRS